MQMQQPPVGCGHIDVGTEDCRSPWATPPSASQSMELMPSTQEPSGEAAGTNAHRAIGERRVGADLVPFDVAAERVERADEVTAGRSRSQPGVPLAAEAVTGARTTGHRAGGGGTIGAETLEGAAHADAVVERTVGAGAVAEAAGAEAGDGSTVGVVADVGAAGSGADIFEFNLAGAVAEAAGTGRE